MNLKCESILVTGADGFIGSHLVEELVGQGCRVRAMVHYNSFGSWGWLDSLPQETLASIEVIAGDVRDRGSVSSAMNGVGVVFHLAALIGIPYSYNSPESYVSTNIGGTLNILEEARRLDTPRVLVTSTSEVYGTARYVPIDESHPLQSQSPYAATKIGADRMADSYFRSYGLPVTIVRPFNTYGPRQSARAVIPSVIGQLLKGAEEIALGSLNPTRDLVYVRDTVRGFCSIAACDKSIGQEINIATQSEVSIGELAALIIKQINPRAVIRTEAERIRPKNSEVERLFGSNSKIREMTGWEPKYALVDGLAETIDWFKRPENTCLYKEKGYVI